MSTVDTVQRAFMNEMLGGQIEPGTWIRQDEVADRLGVSKIPVREALQRLAAIGLVRFETNRGAVVPELSADDALENYTLRRTIEPELLRRAVPRSTIVDLAEAELALVAGESSDLADPVGSSITESNWRFHRALYRASGWERGLAMVEVLHASVAPYVVLYTQDLDGGEDSDAEHRALLASCRSGDVDAAVDQLLGHLDGASNALIDFLDGR